MTVDDDTNISAEAESSKQSQSGDHERDFDRNDGDKVPDADLSPTSSGDDQKNNTTGNVDKKDDKQDVGSTEDLMQEQPTQMEVDPKDETKAPEGGARSQESDAGTPAGGEVLDSTSAQVAVERCSPIESSPGRPAEEATSETVQDEPESSEKAPEPVMARRDKESAPVPVTMDQQQPNAAEAKNDSDAIFDIGQEVNQSGAPPSPTNGGKNGKAFFPMKLYDIVSDEKNVDIIKWLPGGKAFIIVDKKRFANEVLPKHFQQSQFTSFTRKLSRWRFTRVPRGPFIGAYYNKLFLKGHRSLCWHMRCKNENMGKIKLDRKISETIKEMSSLDQATRAAMMHSGSVAISAPPPTTTNTAGIAIHQPFPQGYAPIPQTHIATVPPHLAPQIPNGAHATFQVAGVNPLNTQILAIEGRLRELQNARSAEAYMYEQQQKAFIAQHAMDEISYANQAHHQARSMMEARAAMGMNNIVDYNNPHSVVVRQHHEQQGPPVVVAVAPGGGQPGQQHQHHQQQLVSLHQQQQPQQPPPQQQDTLPPGPPQSSTPGAPMPPPSEENLV
mmetsp:Transcript_3115/g.4541  ORF Transcript_3115/g.4541 Transcript_3115/m.4541 type:complete len:558 (+) Transcript_3115:93-1766(+)|eukprot:CAMPEP_0203676730 /NCGR_PEP_ID=MMETSP0090-20130426/25553_1 /ASSEMBLY_ACC=CAM_ASM_001088 /TAXON_ID=426623 /ORGANISM="Chaetoceros affinis, Strain CCMP159" /LENGTH=557 /DNA_ID=CAMNT_0050543381 /DNA_START=17 /DNA_END=1690 /DNA_ORIENTATION=-